MRTLDPNWVIAILTIVLVVITGVYAFLTYGILQTTRRQASIQMDALDLQNRLLHSQVLAQRFDMYWKTYAPITDEEVDQAALLPEDLMDPDLFESKYRNDKEALRRYLGLVKCYEYLALMNTMKKLEIPDPLGYAWTELWTRHLAATKEFVEINDWYRPYYPEFAELVDAISRAGLQLTEPLSASDVAHATPQPKRSATEPTLPDA